MSEPVAQLLGSGPVLPRRAGRPSSMTRWSIGALGFVILVGVSVAVSNFAKNPERFPVSNVDILGTVDYVDRNSLKESVGQHIGKGFYGLDIDEVRESIEILPWVAQVRVSRIWPSRLEVRVEEHEPSARWNDDQLLSKHLEVFAPPQLQLDDPRYNQWREVFAKLPEIRGAEGRQSELFDAFRQYQHDLAQFGLTLEKLDEDERGSQLLVLSNQVTVRLGYEEQELRMQRFLDVYKRMQAKIERHAAISTAIFDMRYSNGFALGGVETGTSGELSDQSSGVPQGPLQ
ncbi:cell division protein FtsQ/DivIB [Granulosicoccus antarcticus]|uniref:Cell division protein FtsQ n=1 Tax=Granulosicoccus antarcticus IMCC3135 TaxID=1192854 RepID=A0A2Z2P7S5_9GAMM|nr:FtsQ-type POTRA domain-containing protein [Granulosicoccus antarcticus]ASJ75884.1 Cell division protein FtsQ [Granulosicoccus antarcticus IMCC3135]